MYLVLFVVVTIAVVAVLPFIVPWLFKRIGDRASEPEIKFLFLVLFGLGGLANLGKSEAVLPAYLVGMALGSVLPGKPRASAPHSRNLLRVPDAVLLPKGRLSD